MAEQIGLEVDYEDILSDMEGKCIYLIQGLVKQKMPSSMCRMCGFTSSCTCSKSH